MEPRWPSGSPTGFPQRPWDPAIGLPWVVHVGLGWDLGFVGGWVSWGAAVHPQTSIYTNSRSTAIGRLLLVFIFFRVFPGFGVA